MIVTVRLFASLRETAGWSEKEMELGTEATVADLLALLFQELGVDWSGRPVYAAVNQRYAAPDAPLHEGDVIALFPPVSGG